MHDLYRLLQDLNERVSGVAAIRPGLKKEFVNLTELALITGLTEGMLKSRRTKGELKMINYGNTIIIPIAEVERFTAWLRSMAG